MTEAILAEYDHTRELCEGFTERLSELLEQLLAASSVQPHSVTSRLKTRDSLKKKIEGTQGKYAALGDVTDICGVRVITSSQTTSTERQRLLRENSRSILKTPQISELFWTRTDSATCLFTT